MKMANGLSNFAQQITLKSVELFFNINGSKMLAGTRQGMQRLQAQTQQKTKQSKKIHLNKLYYFTICIKKHLKSHSMH